MEATKINSLILTTTMVVEPPGEDGSGGEQITFSYRIGAMGKEFWEWYYSPDQSSDIFDVLERVLVTTGITVGGAPVLPTAEALRATIPAQFAKALFEHIKDERRAGKLRAAS